MSGHLFVLWKGQAAIAIHSTRWVCVIEAIERGLAYRIGGDAPSDIRGKVRFREGVEIVEYGKENARRA